MRLVPSPTARLVLATLVAGLAVAVLPASPSSASAPEAPGDHTGYGFDACVAPSQKVMDAWMKSSPYAVVGIYVSGNSRYCGEAYQPNLSKAWVQRNADNGWAFMPIHVGYQSPCFRNNPDSRVQKKRMSTSTSTARSQGVSDAKETIAALAKYGFPAGSVSYLDIEWYARTATCDNAVLAFSDGFNDTLKVAGYRSGLYSSGSAAIKLVDEVRAGTKKFSGYTLPDQMWFAWTNEKATLDGGPYLSDTGWPSDRIHQFHNGTTETYSGASVNIDRNWMRVGRGSVATREPRSCGVAMSLPRYPSLKQGSTGAAVETLQCLLRERGRTVEVTGTLDATTRSALDAYRRSKGWTANGLVTRGVWTALLSEGPAPAVLKQGSNGGAVWRLQRALRAAGYDVPVDGVYGIRTAVVAKEYRRARAGSSYPTFNAGHWAFLRKGLTRG